MSVREKHVPVDRLTALAFVARAPESDHDRQALTHIAACDRCAGELTRLTATADSLRDTAFAQADALFDEAALDAQRTRVLDRLAHLGHVARVLRFPLRSRGKGLPVITGSRRWISVAAAAGLIIGLVAGQLLHFVPWQSERTAALPPTVRQAGPAIVPAAAVVSLSDDELLDAIEAAVQLRHAHSLRALDALTPIAGDLSLGR